MNARYPLLLLLGVVMCVLPCVAFAGSCTHGVDCYCDKVKPGGPLADPNLLMCEDFEAPTLHDNVGLGNGAPDYGPWYDDTGLAGARGANSYWTRKYGPASQGCAWSQSLPASPILGPTCTFGVCFAAAWIAPDDIYQGGNFGCMSTIRTGEFNAEVSTLTPPTIPNGGSGVFDGQQVHARRVPAGVTSGIIGSASWGHFASTIGITQAVAYATNTGASGIWGGPWKHDEWGSNLDGLFLFHNTGSLSDRDPFDSMFFFVKAGTTQAECNAIVAAAIVRAGNVFCNSGPTGVLWQADGTTLYNRTRDWPFGTWGCVQGHFTGLGTTNMAVKIWFNNKLIIDFSGLNSTIGAFTTFGPGYDGITWNGYANQNSGSPGNTPTTQTTFRYQDNVHIREGAPVSCQQIGFNFARVPPVAPSGLSVR